MHSRVLAVLGKNFRIVKINLKEFWSKELLIKIQHVIAFDFMFEATI